MSKFKNSHILITGGANGIGLLMGKRALKKGARSLIIWDISEENITAALKELSEYKDRISTYTVDISKTDQVYQTAEDTLQNVPHIDILINNAGIVAGKNFDKLMPEDIEQTIGINLLGMIHTSRSLLGGLKKAPSAHIVNIASAAGLMANPGMSVYASSKWGAIGWSESLRIEFNKSNTGINVTTVEPSYIDTGMFKGVSPPLLTPLLSPDDITGRIIKAVEQNKIHLRAPFMVKLLPFLRGVLPAKVFDFVAGKLFRVYHSMDTFTGRKQHEV
ncbi:SDR family NAD(P)-dependent oxidoreductase [Fodinibius halophilus]|uniref:SDR family NAD(P)-dependent oxidoreductase n=1 Tax=Fodinibius halophilus TaxID=1736908 RepID=A0A6M1SZ95_9BACT|nr:SDR family NAD(P)-dependent oxidoreductase [Fodinibius halophilus]NGP88596.1 SDR family NAD(P)-dependent oxidoreductase [Fodinibius halophilus]